MNAGFARQLDDAARQWEDEGFDLPQVVEADLNFQHLTDPVPVAGLLRLLVLQVEFYERALLGVVFALRLRLRLVLLLFLLFLVAVCTAASEI